MSGGGGGGEAMAIIEDDQQLYDWGIENRYDQYYEGRMDGIAGPGTQPPYPDHHPVYAVDGNPRIRPEGYVAALSNASIARTDYRVAAVIMNAGQMQSSGQDAISGKGDLRGAAVDAKRYQPPQILPNGPTASPPNLGSSGNVGRRPMIPHFDMDANEIMKMERKRARNRVAASKCRMRKLERIAVLDHQASQLRADNDELRNVAEKLRAEVYALKQEIKWHVNNGCKVWRNSFDVNTNGDETDDVVKNGENIASLNGDKKKCEIASPDSTTHNVFHHERHIKRERDEELQHHHQQQQQQLFGPHQPKTLLPNQL